jgi:TolB-like protein
VVLVLPLGEGAADARGVTTIPARRSVAVLYFQNLSGRAEDRWLSTALSEMLCTELAAGEKLHRVSGEDVMRAKINLPLSDTDSLAKDTLARLRKNLGNDFVVFICGGSSPTYRSR